MLAASSTDGGRGARLYNVAAGTPILAGEPVQIDALGSVTVRPLTGTTATPTGPDATAHLMIGIAATNSTNTTAAAGSVNVVPISSGTTWLISPKYVEAYDTQAEYDALVGKRVLIENGAQQLTYSANVNAGTYSLLSADSANNGCVVVALDISRYPGKVAFTFRDGCNYLS